MIKNDFGAFLVNAGFIDTQQLQECQQELKNGIPLEKCILEKQFITPENAAKAIAQYLNIPLITSVSEREADLSLLAKVPLNFLRDNIILPLVINGHITLVTSNPFKFQPVDELDMLLGGNTQRAVSTSKIIIDAINRYYPLEGTKEMIAELEEEQEGIEEAVEFGDIEEKDIMAAASEAPIIKLVNHILYQAVKRGASDIHIEPYEKELVVRYRIDGILYQVMTPPKRIQNALISRIKIMSNLNIAEKRVPQDGRIDIKVAGKAIDIRVSILPVSFGERIVMRLLDKTGSIGKIKDLGLSDHDYAIIIEAIQKPNGIIYITGPTGSGKTSTLYIILAQLNNPDVNIITVEDPVEKQVPGIGQVQVKEKIGLTFAAALRSILRQDPDIVMIGETRDAETAQIAIQAALTGHLVLSTLHTNSAPASITRLLDMGVEPYLIASSVVLIVAQRLVRRLCESCKHQYIPSDELIKSLGLTQKQAEQITFYQAVGCEQCNNTGYKGRMAIFEMMRMTPEVGKLTMERADTSRIRKQATHDGMILLIQDGIRKIKDGVTTIEEVLSVATIEQEATDVF
ncbi:MAG TPA: type II secretion system ATPase GspE [Candidatus Dependentiae bacterium]|jgi:general secretion pathway protein E|nr:type II secretion system ATPase GspE [Candidatus Dependentiae bacterium]